MTPVTTTIGIDIGGTKIAAGLVDPAGRVVHAARRDTDPTDPAGIVRACGDLVRELRAAAPAGHEPAAVGLAAAGYIDADREKVLFAPNIAFRDLPLRAQVEAIAGLPVVLENDANAAAYGEFRYGGGAAHDCMVMLTLGTGVGGGIVDRGRVWHGAYGVGGELGHLRVVPAGQLCGCGNHGCLEVYASGTALVREARSLVTSARPDGRALAAACGDDASGLTGPMVAEVAHAGDPAARRLFADIGRWVGQAAASLAAILDPDGFVIGGGVAEVGELLLGPAREAFADQLIGRGRRPQAAFEPARLGNTAGLIGAAALAAQQCGREDATGGRR